MTSSTTALRAYDEAMQAAGVPHEPLEVYTSNSWRRVGLAREYKEVMVPTVDRLDQHPNIRGTDVLVALVAAFNAMLARPIQQPQVTGEQIDALLRALSIESALPELTAMNHEEVRTWLASIGMIQPWQPMETAPKDRNILLVREAHGDVPRTVTHGYWFEEEHGKQIGDCGGPCRCPEYEEPHEPFWFSDDGGFTKEHPPVGWMDLPAPPAVVAREPQS